MLKQLIIVSLFFLSLFNISGQSNNRHLSLKDTINDPAIQVPMELEYNLEQMLVEWKNSYFQTHACDQFAKGDVIYPDSVYINRLYGYPSEMELAYNQIVRSYIDMYTSRRRTSVQYMLAKGKYYFPVIEETLDKYGLPLELKYLPIIESALNPIAVSRAGATGLWQFMLRTGKMYDLEVNSLVDERRDPLKATEAAARYLKDLYDIYEDWNLVIAAYNCGPGNVNKAIRRSGGAKDYWAIYANLPRETRGYVPAFIAATYVMNYYAEHNICPMEYNYPIMVDTIMVDKMLHFKQISEVLNIPVEEIRELNPQYKKDIIPGEHKVYSLCLPSKLLSQFITNQDTIFSHKTQTLLAHRKTVEVEDGGYVSNGKVTKTHKIKNGESLGTIARKYGVTVAHLKKMNNLSSNNIRAGRSLVISRAAAPVNKAKPTTTTASKELAVNTKVKEEVKPKPQELEVIEKSENTLLSEETSVTTNENNGNFFADYYKNKNNEDVSAVESLNDSLVIAITDSIDNVISEKEESLAERREQFDDNKTIYHKVKIGETLPSIAKRYDVSAIEIIAWNKLSSKRIKKGQRLMIKLPEKTDILESHDITEVAENISEAKQTTSTVNPISFSSVSKSKQNEMTPTKDETVIYRVRKGDSLSIIAKKYGRITAEDIMLANNLNSDKLSIGQKLKIPLN